MAREHLPAGAAAATDNLSTEQGLDSPSEKVLKRRSFLKGMGLAGAAAAAGPLLTTALQAQPQRRIITVGDVAILRFLAAAETLETDLWQQYNELGGIQDAEVPGGSGSPLFTAAVE